MFGPLLSEADPAEQTLEGALDPLGLYAIADALALKLAPGVRERQAHPRYLTAMAVGMSVCQRFDPDRFSSDGVSSPCQVFEWYVVEALVRQFGESDAIRGLPGRNKAMAARRNRLPLSAANYLKTPSVFGFFGVYKLLGETVGFFDKDGLMPEGGALLEAWEHDQGLVGFHQGSGSAGAERQKLVSAISDGLDAGSTARSGAWGGWEVLATHLAPYEAGRHEREILWRTILGDPGDPRAELAQFLVSDVGRRMWLLDELSERALHAALKKRASEELRRLLDAIAVYESFARRMQDAFEEVLFRLTGAKRPLSASELSDGTCVIRAAREVPSMRDRLYATLEAHGEADRLALWFDSVLEPDKPSGWLESLLQHHVDNQRRKPPNGKNPWFDFYDDGSVAVRSAYTREEPVIPGDEYVHGYRARPLISFAQDLKRA
jgi:hypothetical protein